MRSLAIVLAMSLMAGCQSKPEHIRAEAKAPPQAAPVAVRVAVAGEAEWRSYYEATGTVSARTSARVASRVMSYVREVHVNIGDRVRAGQRLVVLDARELESGQRRAEAARSSARTGVAEADQAIEAAKPNLDLAESTFRRMKDLFDKKSISNQEFDEASARVRMARANLEMAASRRTQVDSRIAQADEEVTAARIQSGYSVLNAPIAGVVTQKMVEPGNLAVPGMPLLTIEQEGAYRLDASVEESNLSKVRLGQMANVTLDLAAGAFNGKVSEIVPSVDPASRSFVVKVDLPAAAHPRSGMFGRALFPVGSRKVLES